MSSPFNVKKPASVLDHVDEPEIAKASQNFKEERQIGMTFNMPRDWHTEFKVTAAGHQMSMRDFLLHIFDHWKKTGQ